MKNKVIYLSIFLAVGLTATIIHARPFSKWRNCAPHDGCGISMIHHLKALDLSKEQKGKIAIILKGVRSEATSLVDDLAESHTAVANEIHSDSFSETAIRAASTNHAAIKEDLTVLIAHVLADIKETLTPDQEIELNSLLSEFGETMDTKKDFARLRINKWIERHDTSDN